MVRPFDKPRNMKNWFGLRCWLRSCPCRHYEDAGGCGGQCVVCGRVVGYVTRTELRAYADRIASENPAYRS